MSNNSIALVTGAGSGIGRATAVALAKNGFTVVLAGRNHETLTETAGLAPDMVPCPTDITDTEQVDTLFAWINDRFGRLDLLFNNAGTNTARASIDELTVEDWKRCVDVNLTGVFLCARAAFRLMKAQTPKGGRIINNGSVSAHVPRALSPAYTASKHGVTGLTRSISLDGRPHDILCGQIDIGNAATPMTERFDRGLPQADGETRAEPTFDVALVGEAVLHMARLPLSTNVPFMTIMANGMPYIGRG